MRSVRRLLRAGFNVVHREKVERELDAELDACVQMIADEHRAGGATEAEALRRALLEVGGAEQARIRARESRAGASVERLRVDVSAAVRALRSSPAFAVWTAITLALGIGVNVAMFGVVDVLLLRDLPYRDADRLVYVKGPGVQPFSSFSRGSFDVSPAELAESSAFAGVALHSSGALNLGGDSAERVQAAAVTRGFWQTLAPELHIGRTFTPEEARDDPRLAVVAYRFWHRKLGGDTRALGQSVLLNGVSYTVVGVLGEGAGFPNEAEVWIPAAADSVQTLVVTPLLLARLASGVTADQARDETQRLLEHQDHGEHEQLGRATGPVAAPRPVLIEIIPFRESLLGNAKQVATLVAGAAILVLLVALTNAANLFSTQVARREREFAVRSSLGASRYHLLRQVLIEALLLSAIASLAAIVAAKWVLMAIARLLPPTLHGVSFLALDTRVIISAVVLCVLAALIFGMAPALSIPTRGATDVLRGMRATAIDPFWNRLRSGLVVGQIAAALVLLSATWAVMAAATAFLRTDVGARGEDAVTFEVYLPNRSHPTGDAVNAYVTRLEQELLAVPGVAAAGMTNRFLSKDEVGLAVRIHVDGETQLEDRAIQLVTSPGFFSAAGVDLRAGRSFTEHDDAASPQVVIVNEGFARRTGRTPSELIGKRVNVERRFRTNLGPAPGSRWAEVVGVVADVLTDGPDSKGGPIIYSVLAQDPRGLGSAFVGVVRAPANALRTMNVLAEVAGRVDRTVPVFGIRTFDQRLERLLGERRFARDTMMGFGMLASVLAALGLYGALSYAVHSRRREVGIRLAIGARPASVRRQVLATGLRHALVGIAIGSLGAWAASAYGVSAVPGLKTLDLTALAAIAFAVLFVAGMASWLPAYRASRVDPLTTLRAE